MPQVRHGIGLKKRPAPRGRIKSLFFNYTLPGLIAKNWDAIKSGVSEAWANIRQSISDKWNAITADVSALPAKFQDTGSAIIDSILDGINAKWETLKSKLSSVTDYLPDWMTENNKTQDKAQVQVVGGAAAAAVPFAGMYDSGGIIPRGQFGIVGENGPEIVNGPAKVTSRRRTAALASIVAGVMGVAAAPAEAAPLHPYSLPTAAYKQSQPAKSASAPPVMHFETHAPITIYAQPWQSAQDIAREVARQLDERERKTVAKARSNFSDQGDMNNDDGTGVICLHAAYSAISGAAVSAKLATRRQQSGEPATINAVSWPG